MFTILLPQGSKRHCINIGTPPIHLLQYSEATYIFYQMLMRHAPSIWLMLSGTFTIRFTLPACCTVGRNLEVGRSLGRWVPISEGSVGRGDKTRAFLFFSLAHNSYLSPSACSFSVLSTVVLRQFQFSWRRPITITVYRTKTLQGLGKPSRY